MGDQPLEIKSGSTRVTIYPTWDRKYSKSADTGSRTLKTERPQYTVSYYLGTQRKLRKFSSLKKAKTEARSIANQLASGDASAIEIKGNDRTAYVEAARTLRKLDPTMSLDVAIRRFVGAEQSMLDLGANIEDAVRDYAKRNQSITSQKSIPEIVDEFIDIKRKAGKSARYLKDLNRLKKFAETFRLKPNDLTVTMLQEFIDTLGHPRTQKNYHRLICSVIKFAVKRKYANHEALDVTQSVELPQIKPTPTEIYSPTELRELFESSKPELIPWLVIQSLCGLRMAEFIQLEWRSVDLKRKLVTVLAGDAKTGSRRVTPLCDAGVELLIPFKKTSGKVAYYAQENKFTSSLTKLVNERRLRMGQAADFRWKKNALRHSYCSYRLAILKDVAKVAYEAGNSPAMIHKHYHELVFPEDANDWFNIKPNRNPPTKKMPKTA